MLNKVNVMVRFIKQVPLFSFLVWITALTRLTVNRREIIEMSLATKPPFPNLNLRFVLHSFPMNGLVQEYNIIN